MSSAANTGKTVILLECISPVTGLIAVIIYSPCGKLTFNVNGIFYNRLTDSNGQAALNIRLPPGEYIITSSFNGANIANKITITG